MANQWSERVAGHPINQVLADVSQSLAVALDDTELTDQATQYLRRAQLVLDLFKAALEGTDPALVPLAVLESGANSLQQTPAEVQNFLANRNESHLLNVDQQIDQFLVETRSLPRLPLGKELAAATKAAERYATRLLELESSVRDAHSQLTEEIADQSRVVKETEDKIASIGQAADAKVAEVGQAADKKVTQVREEADAKLEEIRAEVQSQKKRLDDAISQNQSTFAGAQEERLNQFSASQKDIDKAYQEQLDKYVTDLTAKISEFDAEAKSYLESLQDYRQRAAQMVGVTAASGVTGGYLSEAKEQRTEADRWRIAAMVVAATLFAGTIVSTVVAPVGTDASISEIAVFSGIRLPVASVIAGAFFYAIRQSGLHRDREQRAKHLALQLTAFRPFLSELPKDQIKAQIIASATRFFPGDEPSAPGAG